MHLGLWAEKVVAGSGNPRIQPGQKARVDIAANAGIDWDVI